MPNVRVTCNCGQVYVAPMPRLGGFSCPRCHVWHPNTSEKQDELRELCRRYMYVLANGPRFSGKTVGALNCVVEHAWNTSPGNVTIVTISQTVGFDSGVWQDLTKFVIPDWISGGFGMDWAREPYLQGVSKKPTLELTNRFGGTTQIQLDSLAVEDEVEDRFKPRRYSMIYVPELSTFTKRNTFVTLTESLRMIGLAEEKHVFLADTNPPDDDSWWIHDLWWDLLDADENGMTAEDYDLDPDDPDSLKALLEMKHSMARIDIAVPDNPFADQKHILRLKAKYAHNDELYRRYILGECVRTTTDSLFHETFRPSFHVVGEIASPNNKDPEILIPPEGCNTLFTGWDPGDSVNSAWCCAAKRFRLKDEEAPESGEETILDFIDEAGCVGENHLLEHLVVLVMLKMAFWEKMIGLPGSTRWVHWSDRSVYERQSTESKKYLAQVIYDTSASAISYGLIDRAQELLKFPGLSRGFKKELEISIERAGEGVVSGPITLRPADRSPGSLIQRIDLWRRMLYDERVFFSAERCPRLVAMNKSIKKPKTGTKPIQGGSPHKHWFDCASYLQSSELYRELQSEVSNKMKLERQSRAAVRTGVVTVPM